MCKDVQIMGWLVALMAAQLAVALSVRATPLVYVYTLPSDLSDPGEHIGRNTGYHFEKRLKESNYYTKIARKANYFLIPFYPMSSDHYDVYWVTFRRVLEYVQSEHPWWNVTHGINHLAVGGWDFGLAALGGLPAFRRIRQLHHFGWYDDTKPWQVTADGRCRFKADDECARMSDFLGPDRSTHVPGKDIIIPDVCEPHLKRPIPKVQRTTRVFFAGSPTNIFREDAFRLFSNASGWRIVLDHVKLDEEMAQSIFCLDLGAGGFSTRFTHAMIHGCIPVWLDELLPPWTGQLPVETFSIRFGVHDMERLPRMLGAISNMHILNLQLNLKKYAKFYHWASIFGPAHEDAYPDAFQFLMETLLIDMPSSLSDSRSA